MDDQSIIEFKKFLFSHLKTKSEIEYSNNIIKDPLFKKDPQTYVKNWTIKRGFTEEFRIPEDRVLGAFSLYYKISMFS